MAKFTMTLLSSDNHGHVCVLVNGKEYTYRIDGAKVPSFLKIYRKAKGKALQYLNNNNIPVEEPKPPITKTPTTKELIQARIKDQEARARELGYLKLKNLGGGWKAEKCPSCGKPSVATFIKKVGECKIVVKSCYHKAYRQDGKVFGCLYHVSTTE